MLFASSLLDDLLGQACLMFVVIIGLIMWVCKAAKKKFDESGVTIWWVWWD